MEKCGDSPLQNPRTHTPRETRPLSPQKNPPPRWPWHDCGQTSASAARLFSYHLSDHYLAASTPAPFVAKPRSQASRTFLLQCAPRPRSASPAPWAQSAGEDFPESAVLQPRLPAPKQFEPLAMPAD